jgi:hypothetical protein
MVYAWQAWTTLTRDVSLCISAINTEMNIDCVQININFFIHIIDTQWNDTCNKDLHIYCTFRNILYWHGLFVLPAHLPWFKPSSSLDYCGRSHHRKALVTQVWVWGIPTLDCWALNLHVIVLRHKASVLFILMVGLYTLQNKCLLYRQLFPAFKLSTLQWSDSTAGCTPLSRRVMVPCLYSWLPPPQIWNSCVKFIAT